MALRRWSPMSDSSLHIFGSVGLPFSSLPFFFRYFPLFQRLTPAFASRRVAAKILYFFLKKKGFLQLACNIPCLMICPKIKLANNMKMMREELEEITKQYKCFRLKAGPNTNGEIKLADLRETSSIMGDKALIVGRTREKQVILASLSEQVDQAITILPIYGIGGIGKTTLAKLVFNDTQFKDYCQVWVYVSQTFDLNKISNSIISQLSRKESQLTEGQMIHSHLRELLAGKKILIVLDDLWEDDKSLLDHLMDILSVAEGAKLVVLVTTRDEGIAAKFCTIRPLKLEPLTDDMCWSIIKQRSAFESRDDKEQLELIGEEIATKCSGVALAAQSLGYMLRSMTSSEWESVRNSDIWKISALEDIPSPHHKVLASLMLSYSSMPSYLKQCFAYCAIFPKGHNIVKDDLVHQWVALGFIEETNIFSTRQLSERYIKQLLGLSFLQHSKSPANAGLHHEDVTLLTMHDLVHDVARVMVDEILLSSKQGNTVGISYRYALLNSCINPLESSTGYPAKIRALRFMNCKEIGLSDGAFSSAKSLRVLDLSECYIQKLPDSIDQFKKLRYLNAPGVQYQMIPNCITKLIKLMYLSLRGSSKILSLPGSIGEMEGLMYLDLSDCSGIQELPKSFSKLQKLVHLDFSNCSCIKSLSQCLGSLTELQYLNLSCSSDLCLLDVEFFGKLTKLEYLNLSCGLELIVFDVEFLSTLTNLKYLNLSSKKSNIKILPEDLGKLVELKYLSLSGCGEIVELPIFLGKLKNLVHLDLSCCVLSTEHLVIGWPEVIGSLTNLRYLNLSQCMDFMFHGSDETDRFIDCISRLSNLEHLDLSNNAVLRSLPESIGSLKKLHTLNLSGSRILTRFPECLIKMESLKVLNVKGCNVYEDKLPQSNFLFTLPDFVVHAGDGESSSNLALLEHAKLDQVLALSKLENVKSVQEARSIKLMEKHGINHLELEWTRGTDRFVEDMNVLEEIVPPGTLKNLVIKGYSSVRLPGWIMRIAHHLGKLVEIMLWDLPKCNSLPPLGQLPNLEKIILGCMHGIRRIDGSIYGGSNAFPSLTEFYLLGMGSLEELDLGGFQEEGMFPELQYFETSDCPRLRLKSCPPRAVKWEIVSSDNVLSSWGERWHHAVSSSCGVTRVQISFSKLPMHQWGLLCHLPALIDLHIQECNNLTSSSPEIIRAFNLNPLKSLTLTKNVQAELPRWLGELTCLQDLSLSDIQDLDDLEGNISQLTSLHSLKILCCYSMTSLPGWVGELASLRYLELTRCTKLNEFQENLCNLISLKVLKLYDCPTIRALPERMGDLNSLKELEIIDCKGINSLPESIQQLTNLKKLRIKKCPGLLHWCTLDENKKKLAHIKEKIITWYLF
uniref:Uncharacterized protein n=1 Tax=Oryza brachyantha TaxID=4533 RepID=J3N6T5_ORYBR